MVRTNGCEDVKIAGKTVKRVVRNVKQYGEIATGNIQEHGSTLLVRCERFYCVPRVWDTIVIAGTPN